MGTETRAEIRNRVLLRAGFTTGSSGVSSAVEAQVNELIREAALEVYEEHPWARHVHLARVSLSEGTALYAYPTADVDAATITVGPEGVLEAALWDAEGERYKELRRSQIPLADIPDATLLSGDDLTEKYDEPLRYETGRQLRFDPVPDADYTVMLRVVNSPDIGAGGSADSNVSAVDAELIVLRTLAGMLASRDPERAARYESKFGKRVAMLRSNQNPGLLLQFGADRRGVARELIEREYRYGREPFNPAW